MKPSLAEADMIDIDDLEAASDRERSLSKRRRAKATDQRRSIAIYLLLPAIFLTVTLLGGLRLAAADNAFVFLKPALVCLVFAAVSLVLFFRSTVVAIDGW